MPTLLYADGMMQKGKLLYIEYTLVLIQTQENKVSKIVPCVTYNFFLPRAFWEGGWSGDDYVEFPSQ